MITKFDLFRKKAPALAFLLFPIVLDRVLKLSVSLSLPETIPSEAALNATNISLLGDMIWIVHVKNALYIFGIANKLGAGFQTILFGIFPAAIILLLVVFCIFSKYEIESFRLRTLMVLCAGALANEADRIVYAGRVVDLFGLRFLRPLGLTHWPIFNLADAFVAVAAIILAVSLVRSCFSSAAKR